MRRVVVVFSVLTAAVAGHGSEALAKKAGPEFRVNTYTTSAQDFPSVAGLTDGAFVVTWESFGQDGNNDGVFGQRVSAKGKPLGKEFQVNTETGNAQGKPSVAGLADGGYVVTWQSYAQGGPGNNVFGQRFSARGKRRGGEFPVNTYKGVGDRAFPSVAGLGGGGFVVTWHSTDDQDGSGAGVYGRRFNAKGKPRGGEFWINTSTEDDQSGPTVAGLAGGGFVVTWQSNNQDGSGWGVYGRRYNDRGKPRGAAFRVNTYTMLHQAQPCVAGLSDGGFVVTWNSLDQDGSDYGVYGQRYKVSGKRRGGEFRVNTTTEEDQANPTIVGLSDGGFVVAWTYDKGPFDPSFHDVYGQRYSAKGKRRGGEFQVNTHTTSHQDQPSVAALSEKRFIVTWTSLNQDGDGYGIYGQRFR